MNRFRTGMAVAAATIALAGLATTGSAGAAADPVIGMQVLNLLCTAHGGAPVNSPFTIARCQGARANAGFEIEQLVCDGLLDGTFASVSTPQRPRRVNWFCFPGAPS